MRKCLLIISFLITLSTYSIAQSSPIDSLKNLLGKEQPDTGRVILLCALSNLYSNYIPDTALALVQQGLSLSRKSGFVKGEALCLDMTGIIFSQTGDYPKALELEFQALKQAERLDEEGLLSRFNSNIGVVYSLMNDEKQAIIYEEKGLEIAACNQELLQITTSLLDIGDSYEKLNVLDSARYFTNRGYEMALQIKDPDLTGDALNNLGNIYAKMHQFSLAMDYYRADFSYLKTARDDDSFCETYLGMARIFQQLGIMDSCLFYAKLSRSTARRSGFTGPEMDACNFLTGRYKELHNIDSAFFYLSAAISAKDSLFSEEKSKTVHNMTFQENIRQQDIAEQKKRDQDNARKNLQRAGIAVFIPAFFLFVLLLSRTKIKSRTVEFLGIVGLLLFFEFITDLIYPYISNWTNESPIWETLIFVILAACLEPISFKLEHWIKKRLLHQRGKALPNIH
jgi:tetratricopeptide (TPR) repeat protein